MLVTSSISSKVMGLKLSGVSMIEENDLLRNIGVVKDYLTSSDLVPLFLQGLYISCADSYNDGLSLRTFRGDS
jgi:hypothetical protein